MNSRLKIRLMTLVLLLFSIPIIYSGCCRKKNNKGTYRLGSKQKKIGSRSGNPEWKPEGNSQNIDDNEKYKVILQRIENYTNGNRKDLKTTWRRELKDGSLYLYFGLFKFIIPKVEIDKIKDLKNEEQILNLSGVIQIGNETITYIFDNNGRCNFKELLESLDVLEKEYRREDDEHLCVVEVNNKINGVCYINIKNGAIYMLNNPAGLGRLWYGNTKGKNEFSCIIPYYRNGKYFGYKCNESKNEISKNKYINLYNKQSIKQEVIQTLKFKIKIK